MVVTYWRIGCLALVACAAASCDATPEGGTLTGDGGADASTEVDDVTVDTTEPPLDAPIQDAADLSWHPAPALPSPRQSAACAAFGGAIFVAGGLVLPSTSNPAIDELLRLDPGAPAWSVRKPMPVATCCMAVATMGERIFFAGGYQADGMTPSDRLLVYDPAADSWQEGPPMPTPRALATAVEWNGQLAVVGGRTGFPWTVTGVIELFDPVGATWSRAPTTEPTPREAAVGVRAGGKLIVAGGYPDRSLYGVDTVDIFETNWSAGPTMPRAGGQMAFGVTAQGLVVAGGWGPSGHSGASSIWDLHGPAWTRLPDLPTARAGACGAIVGNDFYAVGGGQFTPGGLWTSVAAVEVLRQ
jgi:N-acetylneuraminic acid mutarotase